MTKNKNKKSVSTKKTNNKKDVKITSKNKETKKNSKLKIIIPLVAVLIILVVALLIVLTSGKKTISCTKNTNENGVKTSDEITINMKNENINNIIVNKTLSIDKEDGDVNYLSAVKDALEDAYKNIDIDYNIKQNDDELVIDLTYDEEKEYILDNIFINLEDDGLSVNVISEDRENNYATIDLSKEYSDKNIIKILEKADYSCKN